jgi:hypothetical protein
MIMFLAEASIYFLERKVDKFMLFKRILGCSWFELARIDEVNSS